MPRKTIADVTKCCTIIAMDDGCMSSSSSRPMSQSTRRTPSACKKTGKNWWPSMTFRLSTGRAFGPATRLSRPLAQSAIGPNDPRVVCRVTACCTWCSNLVCAPRRSGEDYAVSIISQRCNRNSIQRWCRGDTSWSGRRFMQPVKHQIWQ